MTLLLCFEYFDNIFIYSEILGHGPDITEETSKSDTHNNKMSSNEFFFYEDSLFFLGGIYIERDSTRRKNDPWTVT